MPCDPLRDLRAWQERLERLAARGGGAWDPPMDVYETAEPSFNERDCSIGGMARTQWAWAPTARTLLYDDPKPIIGRWRAVGTRRLDQPEKMRLARAALELRIQFHTNEVFGELNADIISPANHVPFIHSLTVQTAPSRLTTA